jgi:predicted nucleic acid-binding protein
MSKKYYFDTCIWLNLFKKEGDIKKGTPYWKLAKNLINKIKEENNKIIVSTIILKELSFKTKNNFNNILTFFKKEDYIILIKTTNEDYDFARTLEHKFNYELSFYDFLHISISKRLDIPLITRDKDLIKIGSKIINIFKPEDLID